MNAGKQSAASVSAKTTKGNAAKVLTIQEYKRRLRDSMRSLNDNFTNLIAQAKINQDESAHKNQNGRMADYIVTKYEMDVRAALIVRACDELMKLTNDLKEFLILHDFNFLTEAIANAELLNECVFEVECEDKLKRQLKQHNELRVDISRVVFDIDKELQEHFSLRP